MNRKQRKAHRLEQEQNAAIQLKLLQETVPRDVDYLCVLDFEATCQGDQAAIPTPQEIIEFPTLLLNVASGEIESTFHQYLKPDIHPTLSAFCTELTGIEQATVDQGILLDEALILHQDWLNKHQLVPWHLSNTLDVEKKEKEKGADNPSTETKKTFVYLTCGDWDLLTCLPNQLAHSGKTVPSCFHAWINFKHAYEAHYDGEKVRGMASALAKFGLKLEGRHHSGIDDCKNIAWMCQQMLQDGWRPMITRCSISTRSRNTA
jgi:ERI1 exoribonuclease 3